MKYSKLPQFIVLTLALCGAARADTVTFDELDASASSVTGAALTNYLSGHGISITGLTSGTQMVVASEDVIYGGNVVQAPSPNNVLGQQGTAYAASFTLTFDSAVSNVSFDRVGILGAINPTSFPYWSATVFSTGGTQLASVYENLASYYYNLAPKNFAFNFSDVGSIRFDGNANGYAAFTNVLIDNVTFTPSKVPDATATLPLLAGALAALGAMMHRQRRNLA